MHGSFHERGTEPQLPPRPVHFHLPVQPWLYRADEHLMEWIALYSVETQGTAENSRCNATKLAAIDRDPHWRLVAQLIL